MGRSLLRHALVTSAVVAVVALTAAGCSGPPAGDAPTTPTTSATPLSAAAAVPPVTDDLGGGSAHHDIGVAGEPFTVKADTWTDADVTQWQTLPPKVVNSVLNLVPIAGEGQPAQVTMAAVTVTTALAATMPGLDGLVVDTWTETAPGQGFALSQYYPYAAAVSVLGYSQPLVDRWTYLAGDQPLTDEALRTAGVYANRITFSWTLLVRNDGDLGHHQRLVTDTITVPIADPAASAPSTPASTTAAG
ncbi:hypothetical protein [Nakamurella leprariae]|uniref:Lipoprotein LpqN n=1 Tax=Nakamurella leprariae TaxID=2803911 RepID=A0A939C3K2_9ACTN|nr:hypothetical protein [Nakamurella leprariae]MBM9469509.1 hypothetical protein [Nakamurella leprariae]